MGSTPLELVYVKGVLHEIVDNGTVYCLSSHQQHLEDLKQIKELLRAAHAAGNAHLVDKLELALSTISRQIPSMTITSEDVRQINQLCSLMCTIPSETSVGMLPFQGLKAIQVTVEGEYACLHLDGLFALPENSGGESKVLICEIFEVIRLSAMQAVNRNTCALHLLVARGNNPAPAVPADIPRALDVLKHVRGGRASGILPPPESFPWAAAGSSGCSLEKLKPVQLDVVAAADQDNSAPAAPTNIPRALDLIRHVRGGRGVEILPPPESFACQWAAAGPTGRSSELKPPRSGVMAAAGEDNPVADPAAVEAGPPAAVEAGPPAAVEAGPLAAVEAGPPAAVAAAPGDNNQQMAPVPEQVKHSGASMFVRRLTINSVEVTTQSAPQGQGSCVL